MKEWGEGAVERVAGRGERVGLGECAVSASLTTYGEGSRQYSGVCMYSPLLPNYRSKGSIFTVFELWVNIEEIKYFIQKSLFLLQFLALMVWAIFFVLGIVYLFSLIRFNIF